MTPGPAVRLPELPGSREETGLTLGFLTDLMLRHIYYRGTLLGMDLSGELCLPWSGVVTHGVDFLIREHWVEMKGGSGLGRASVELMLTATGREVARDALGRSAYIGPAPVPVKQYNQLVLSLAESVPAVTRQTLERAFEHLVIEPQIIDQFGPALSGGRSLFLYGPPGNGKTSIAETASGVLGGETLVPYAIEVDGQVIKLFDPMVHHTLSAGETSLGVDRLDRRWVPVRRPSVVVGGELTLETLDLTWDHDSRYYEAPFQLKANGGMLLIDDFGRQRVHPTELLNRWIVPLEKGVDYLTLHTGKKFEVPFRQLVVFSTNLDPGQLVDEAFLRRIKYKVEIPDPSEQAYKEIFRRECLRRQIPYAEAMVDFLLSEVYAKRGIPPRACHPRDLLDLLLDVSRYHGEPARLSREGLLGACDNYFSAKLPR